MFERAKYKDSLEGVKGWEHLPDPAATIKYDGASFFVPVSADGSLSFISRRPSVKGGYPDRTASLPHLTDKKYPQLAGHVYNVELIHTGFHKNNVESHRLVSGILNSLPPRAQQTQLDTGPIRAVLHNVINPALPTYKAKMKHLQEVERLIGKPDLIFVPKVYTDKAEIRNLIAATKLRNQEGVIVASLEKHESENPRFKIKHKILYNLRITRLIQEIDKNGVPKHAVGAAEVCDASGATVAKVGTGFSRAQRIDAIEHPENWLGRLIQVESMGLAKNMLRMPVYNGDADGEIDLVERP